MKNLTNFKRFLFISILSLTFVFSISLGLINLPKEVFALENNPGAELVLPKSDLEYKALSSPIDVYHDDKITAIINNDSLLINVNGQYKTPITNFNSIKQVKKANDNTLLVSDGGIIYSINISSPNQKTAIKADNGDIIGGNYFDLNENYLVTAFSKVGSIYKRTANEYKFLGKFTLDGDKPIAINNKGEIFFENNGIYTVNSSDVTKTPKKISNASPSKMIANDNYVYYLLSTSEKVYQLNLNNNYELSELTANSPDYDLGNLSSPSGITFKNENLLITDNVINAVQEFKIEGTNLVFTGFAICADKTAYNRITKDATDVEKIGNTVAVLDDFKLTVINKDNANPYAKENFKNFIIGKDIDQNVQYFTLGNDKILFSNTNAKIKILDLNNSSIKEIKIPVENALVDDLCYQSGYFYALIHTSTASIVYQIDENDENAQLKDILNQTNSYSFDKIAVDVYKNIYLAGTDGIYKYQKTNSNYKKSATVNQLSVSKILTDLGGKLYVLSDSKLRVYDGSIKDVTPTPYVNGDQIKSFAMYFDQKEISLLYGSKEYIIDNDSVNNYAISQISISDEVFKITDKNASLSQLKRATVKNDSNLYYVDRVNSGFTFNNLAEKESEYVYICEIKFDDKFSLYALGGQNGVVLVDKTQVSLNEFKLSSAPTEAFITTNVNAYYMPLVTRNAEYSLKDLNTIRLQKFSKISPISKLTVLDKDFYYASVTVNGNTYKGFIPVDFTVEILSSNVFKDSYTIERTNKTTLYSDSLLTTSIFELEDGQSVRVMEKGDGYAKVLVSINGDMIEGFISLSAIKAEEKIAVRNVLIILGVSICVFGTATYFILRKKK